MLEVRLPKEWFLDIGVKSFNLAKSQLFRPSALRCSCFTTVGEAAEHLVDQIITVGCLATMAKVN